MATIPATTRKPDVPVIGFIAHVDTSPEMSGARVKPIVHGEYDGRDIVLPDDPYAVLRVADIALSRRSIGHDIVTASGTTLLGADNKSGVAEIMTAAEQLLAHPEIPHGPIRIAFTPDEEIGQRHEILRRRALRRALRLHDGWRRTRRARVRELLRRRDHRSRSAASTRIPGYAKDRMVNAIKLAARLHRRGCLPTSSRRKPPMAAKDSSIPYVVDASVDRTSVKLLLRDFDTAELAREGGVAARSSRARRSSRCARRARSRSRSKSPTGTCAR